MRSTLLARQRAPEDVATSQAVLGDTHPLARALRDRGRERQRVLVAAAVLAGAGMAAVAAPPAEPPLIMAAAIVLVAFACRLALLADEVRREALRAIADGRDGLPLQCVRAERRRLEDARLRAHLAAWVEELVRTAEDGATAPLMSAAALRPVGRELGEIAQLLRTGHAGLRGVAMIDLLLTNGVLPLYGDDSRRLAEELARARYHLHART